MGWKPKPEQEALSEAARRGLRGSPEEWREIEEQAKEPTPSAANVLNEYTAPAVAAHVHDWTVYHSGKRKCKPCGAIERPK